MKVASLLCLSFCGAVAAPVHAETLWQNLNVGMTKDEVKALYPDSQIAITPECNFKIITKFANEKLTAVWLKMGDRLYTDKTVWHNDLHCKEVIRATVLEKYGQPDRHTTIPKPGGDTLDEFLWKKEHISIVYVASQPGTFQNMTYTYDPTKVPVAADAKAAVKL